MTILIEAQFFPPITYFAHCVQADSVIIEAHEHFQKGSYRNRCHIAGANGLQTLNVPLRRQKDSDNIENIGDIKSIKNIKIAYDVDWQRQQWRSLQTAYGSAPFWDFYAPVFERFFTKRYDYLLEYNLDIIKTIFKLLKIEKDITLSLSTTYTDFFTEGSDLRQTITPKTNSPMGVVNYSQLFNDRYAFIPHLSILDLLFCCGNQSLSVLKKTLI